MEELAEYLQKIGVLKTPSLVSAFKKVRRRDFLPESEKPRALEDCALSIGSGQTNSQPYTVAFMLELLRPGLGQKILDVGFGSGWTTALLSEAAGGDGQVWGLELAPEIFEFGKSNLSKTEKKNYRLLRRSGWKGLPEYSPFDRILVSASAEEVPEPLLSQLARKGRMVIPIRDYSRHTEGLRLIEKTASDKIKATDYPGFVFVPLVH